MENRKPRALLINPPVYDFALFDLFLKPYGLFRIARLLAEAGYDIIYIDALDYRDYATAGVLKKPKRNANGTGKFFRESVSMPEVLKNHAAADFTRGFARYGVLQPVLRDKIDRAEPDIAFLASGMTYWYQGLREAAGIVRHFYPGIPVIVGGIYAGLMPDHCKAQTGADRVCTVLNTSILDDILRSAELPGVPRGGDMPVPIVGTGFWGDAAVMRLNEGCPYNCRYCSSGILSPVFSPGNPEEAFRQFEELYQTGIRNFAFYDDAFLAEREKSLVPFLRRVMESSCAPSFYTPNAVHVGLLDRDTAVLMKRAGFKEIRLGFESSSRDFHEQYGRKYAAGSFNDVVAMLVSSGFRRENIGVYILAGLPGQYVQEVRDSVKAASSEKVRIYLAEFSPVPGSPLWQACVEASRLPLEEEPLFHNNTFFPMEWAGFSRKDLQGLKDEVRESNRHLGAG